jgi:ABC-type bacteriocin/lantibiotic exporter with double-glycine peptidase domain
MRYGVAREIVYQIIKRWNPEQAQYRLNALPEDDHHSLQDMSQWIGRLQEMGRDVNLHFLDKELEFSELEEVLKVSPLPIIVFEPHHNQVQPLLIWREKGSIQVLRLQYEEWVEEQVEDLEILAERFLDRKDVFRSPERREFKSIFALLPLIIDPIASYESDKPYTPMRRLWHLLGTEKRDIFYIYVYAIVVGLLSLSLPLGVQAIIGLISGGLIINSVVVLIGAVITGTLLSGILQVMQMTVVETLEQRLFTRAAFEFTYRLPRIRLESLLKNYAPELVNRFFDILTLQKGFAKIFTELITAVLQILFGILLLAFYHPFFVFFGILLLLILVAIFAFTGEKGLKTSLEESKYKYKVVHWLEELGRNLTMFKLIGNSTIPISKMNSYLSGYLYKRKSHFSVLVSQFTAFVVFKTLITGGVLILGSILVIDRRITLGQFVASEIVIISVIAAIEKLITNLNLIYDMLTAVEKVGNITDLPLDKHKPLDLKDKNKLHIKVKNLTYTYPDTGKLVLKGIDLEVQAGEYIAIVGGSDAGKTTLVKVLMGLMENYGGTIAFNDFNLRDLNSANLQDLIGDCLSHEDLFEGTLLENLTVGRQNYENEDLIRALEITELLEAIQEMPQGLQTQILPSGKGFSSTFRKKVILARSIIGNPRLLVFDDFFFNLEGNFKKRVLDKIMDKQNRKHSIIAVSHDPIFLERADKIYFLKEGRMAAVGTLGELISNPEFMAVLPTAIKA